MLYDDSLAANPAGTGTVVRGLLGALRRTDGVEVVVSRFEARSLRSVDVRRKAPAHRLLSAAEHLRYFAVELPGRARRARCDVIFSPTSLGPVRGRIPSVITVHDLAPLRYAATFNWVSRVYLQAMLRTQVRRSAAVCTGTRAVAAEILSRFPNTRPDRVYVVPDAPDSELIRASDKPVDDAVPPFFLMVGTIEPRKNHITAIQAFAAYLERHPNAPELLVLAGSLGWLYQPVLEVIRSLGLNSRVRRLGRVEAGELHWLYRHARALLFPSLYEGFGIPVVEAFALGCPVIAARIPPVIEVAGDGTAMLLDPSDVDAWARAIATVASARRDEAMTAAARSRAGAFTWPAAALAVREALLAASGAGVPRSSATATAAGRPPGMS